MSSFDEKNLGSVLFRSLHFLLSKAEKRIDLYVINDKRKVSIFDAKIDSCNVEKCFEYKRKGYLFLQLCVECKLDSTSVCCNHMENANEVCNVPKHTGTVFWQYENEKTMDFLSKLANLGGNTAQPSELMRNSYTLKEYSKIFLTATVMKENRRASSLRNVDLPQQAQMKDPQHIREWLIYHLVAN